MTSVNMKNNFLQCEWEYNPALLFLADKHVLEVISEHDRDENSVCWKSYASSGNLSFFIRYVLLPLVVYENK